MGAQAALLPTRLRLTTPYDAATTPPRSDGYGQTGADYAYTAGLQMAAIRRMIVAVGGDAYAYVASA